MTGGGSCRGSGVGGGGVEDEGRRGKDNSNGNSNSNRAKATADPYGMTNKRTGNGKSNSKGIGTVTGERLGATIMAEAG